MKKFENVMILNGKNIKIKKVELNKSDLIVSDISNRYCFKVCLLYNWKDVNALSIGEKKTIDFNEYCLSENNEAALIYPSNSQVEKINEHLLYFYFDFEDLSNITYMNQRKYFDIKLDSLIIRVGIDIKSAIDGEVRYNFN